MIYQYKINWLLILSQWKVPMIIKKTMYLDALGYCESWSPDASGFNESWYPDASGYRQNMVPRRVGLPRFTVPWRIGEPCFFDNHRNLPLTVLVYSLQTSHALSGQLPREVLVRVSCWCAAATANSAAAVNQEVRGRQNNDLLPPRNGYGQRLDVGKHAPKNNGVIRHKCFSSGRW